MRGESCLITAYLMATGLISDLIFGQTLTIYRTAGQLSKKENSANFSFTNNPISPGLEYSLLVKTSFLLGSRKPPQ